MMARTLNQLTALAFVAGVAVLANAAPAKAALMVTYSTSGVFTKPLGNPATISGGGTIVKVGGANSATITFVGQPLTTVGPVPPETFSSFGTILESATGTGATFSNIGFALTITQTVPTPSGGAVSFTDTLSGKITSSASGVSLTFDNPLSSAFTFSTPYGPGSVTYRVQNEYLLNAPSSGGVTTINGGITGVLPTPEPGTVALALTGLPLLGLAAWRCRTRKNAVV